LGIILKCFAGAGDHEADPINDSLIATRDMAVARGTGFIRRNYFDVEKYSWGCPHKSNTIIPYSYVPVYGERLGLEGAIMKVTDYEINCKAGRISAQIGLEYYPDGVVSICPWSDNFIGADGDPINSTIWDTEELAETDFAILGNKAVVSDISDEYTLWHNAEISSDKDFEVEVTYSLNRVAPDAADDWGVFRITLSSAQYYVYMEHEIYGDLASITAGVDGDVSAIKNFDTDKYNGIFGIKRSGLNFIFKYNRQIIMVTPVAATQGMALDLAFGLDTTNSNSISIDNFRFISGCPSW
jgi:hypothetical protein